MPTDTPTILLVDDHALVREGVAHILSSAGHQWHVLQTGSGFEALDIVRHNRVDAVVTDISMPGINGLDLVRRLRGEFADLGLVVLSMHGEEQQVLRALKAGANAYVTKDQAAAELVNAVSRVLRGVGYVSPKAAESLVRQLSGAADAPPHSRLTDRELEVLRRLVAGQRPGAIAQALHLSPKTVSSHKRRVHEKLGLHSDAALVRYGIEQGLVPDGEGSTA